MELGTTVTVVLRTPLVLSPTDWTSSGEGESKLARAVVWLPSSAAWSLSTSIGKELDFGKQGTTLCRSVMLLEPRLSQRETMPLTCPMGTGASCRQAQLQIFCL